MKILVFDDSRVNQISAKITLAEHDITVVGTYDEAQKALVPQRDWKKRERLEKQFIADAGLPADFNPWANKDASEADKEKYEEARSKAIEQSTTYSNFDVVLTDLLVPASRQAQGPEGERFVGQEMPIGTTIALLALYAGVKNVAVVTDKNHHDHPGSAAFDCFDFSNRAQGIRLICTNRVHTIPVDERTGEVVSADVLKSEEGKKKYPYKRADWGPREGLGYAKDWGRVLKVLLGEPVED